MAFGWRPVLVPELLRDERRVWCGEFAYELRFIVDALVQGAAKACSETTAPGAHLERSAIDTERRIEFVLAAIDFAFAWLARHMARAPCAAVDGAAVPRCGAAWGSRARPDVDRCVAAPLPDEDTPPTCARAESVSFRWSSSRAISSGLRCAPLCSPVWLAERLGLCVLELV